MKNIKRILKALGIYLAIFSLVFSNMQGVFAVTVNENKEQNQPIEQNQQAEEIVNEKEHATGANPLTEEDKKWMEENMITSETILPNKLGLERSNEVREEKGLEKIDESTAVEIGDEVIPDSTKATLTASNAKVSNISSLGTVTEGATSGANTIDPSYLPSGVDNSELPFFPEIRDQGGMGSCASFATTYYQATYMTAMARGWDVKHGDNNLKFSPKWTYNFLNGGENGGTSQIDAFKLFREQGIATWSDFPYNEGDCTPKDYLEWPLDENIWQRALSYKSDKAGYEMVCDGTETPVNGEVDENTGRNINAEKDNSLDKVKQLLSNGYVLAATVDIKDHCVKPIKDNPATTNDDKNVGRAAIYMIDNNTSADAYLHAMTVVGYNDDIWVDINGNGNKDNGEMGAFKVANSWGVTWGIDPVTNVENEDGDGFIWICYDALNKVSAIEDNAPTFTYERTPGFGQSNWLLWMTAKTENTPSLIAAIDITHQDRNNLTYEIGYSETTEENPKIIWKPAIINLGAGDFSFDGSSGTASQGKILLDYSNFINEANLNNKEMKWYVRITDSTEPIIAENINFKLIDPINEKNILCNSEGKIVNGKTITISIKYTLNSTNNTSTQLTYRENAICDYEHLLRDIVTYTNPLTNNSEMYMYDVVSDKLIKYDCGNDKWSIHEENWIGRNVDSPYVRVKLVACEDKIYVFIIDEADYNKGGPLPLKKVRVYNINTQNWQNEPYTPDMPELRSDFSLSVLDGKIYVLGGSKYTAVNGGGYTREGPTNSILEYNTYTNTWTSKAGMLTNRMFFSPMALNGKIYSILGSTSESGARSIEEFDPGLNISKDVGFIPENISIDDIDKIVGFKGKIYIFMKNFTTVHVYDPESKTWGKDYSLSTDSSSNIVKECGDGIFIMPYRTTRLIKFNPSIQDIPPRVGIPYFSMISGSSLTEKTIKISCFTSGAKIMYTIKGTISTSSLQEYTEPIVVAGDKTIEAFAIKDGMENSYVNTANYGIVEKPEFSLGEGSYKQGKKLTITCATEGTVIKYTTNGTTPDANSPVYDDNKPIYIIGNVKVKAIAIKAGKFESDITTEDFRIRSVIGDVNGDGQVDKHDIYPIALYVNTIGYHLSIDDELWGGDLNGDGSINRDDLALMSQFIDEKINYFPKEIMPLNVSLKDIGKNSVTIGWDDSLGVANIVRYEVYRNDTLIEPNATGTSYTDTSVTANTDYVYKVYSVLEDGKTSNPSIPLSVKAGVVVAPTLSVAGGTYTSKQEVTINCATPEAKIFYTTDGTEPTSASKEYTEPITIAGTKTIKVKAIKDGMTDSSLVSAEYIMLFNIGDVNGDGSVDIVDLPLLKLYLTDSTACLVEDPLLVADVNGDKLITILDYLSLKSILQAQ